MDALNDLMGGIDNHPNTATLSPLIEAWLEADAEDGLCLSDLLHAFSQLDKYRCHFGTEEVGRMFDLLAAAKNQTQTAPLVWVPFRAACEEFPDLSVLCDAFVKRKNAEDQAAARMVEAFTRLVVELRHPMPTV